MEPTPAIHQLRMDSSDSSCSNQTRSIASLGGSEDSVLEERTAYPPHRGRTARLLSDSLSPDEQDSGFNSTSQLEGSPNNGSLRCRTPEIKSPRQEDTDDVWLPRFPRARKLGADRVLGTSGSLGSTDSWIENSVSEEEEEDLDDGDMARCLTSMTMGSGVVKVKGSGRCAMKTLYLDGNKSCIRWRPSKKGNKAKISIESIKEIREGPNTDTFKKYLATGNKCPPKTCFSIIHSSSWETFDLIVDTEEETAIWVRGLKHLLKGVRSEVRRVHSNKLRDCWLKATFEAADKSGDGLLSMDEVLKLLHKLNVNLSKRKVKQLFKEADSQDDNIGKLDFDEFIHFYRTISTRQEVDLLLREYSHSKGYMTLEEFARYLKEEQGMGEVELELCQELVQTYEPIPENSKNGWMGIDGFTRFLLSHEGDIFNPAHREVNQDMTRPLTHYYISSSHNTYLVGDQLMSQSSVDVYALVLQAGCRCVEMDCWDGKDGEPIIYHGYTLTSKIKFRDVISIISKYAFVTSPYPVILSIENHCSLEQQKKMAQYLVEILGDMLHVPSPDPHRTCLPSPEELKGKILIKAKKLPEDHNENLEAGEVSEEDSADELDDDLKLETSSISKKFESVALAQLMLMRKKPITPTRSAWQRIVSKVREDSQRKESNSRNHGRSGSLTGTLRRLKLSKKKPKSQSSSESSEGGSLDLLEKSATDEETAGDGSTTGSSKSPSPQPPSRTHKGKSIVLCRQLSQLVQLTRSVGFRGFKSTMLSWELPSLGEIRASNLVATKAPDFTQFTINHLCRVYPSAYRIDSSNYNPQPMWNCGCQLVALNYQTEGRPMQLSRARFSVNGNCGYTLKHPLLCDESKSFDPNSGDPVPHLPKKQLTLHVISGQQLPKPPQSLLGERGEIIDPYVEVEIIGLPIDCAKSQTKTIQDNGFNPFWDCTMTFTLHLPEMALIRFAVWDEDPIGRDFIGQATFSVASLMPGYRHVHLEGLDQATLFVHVAMEDYNTWVNNTARFRPRGSQCRTKSVELEYSPLSSSPTHRQYSPRRKSSLGLVQKLNMRRRHSMAALPPRELSPLPMGTRMKRRSCGDGNMTGSAGELRSGEELSKHYFELTLTCTDTVVDIILNSPISAMLEVDGTYCISVDDLPDVFALNIPPSALFSALRDQKISLKSNESLTSVQRSFMRGLPPEELECSLQKCETESLVSSMSYEQFVQDVFEDCFSSELSYDPCPDLLKEASPNDSSDTSGISDTGSPGETSSTLESTDCAGNCNSDVETATHANRESSDDDCDDVFFPDASKEDGDTKQPVSKECISQREVTKPLPIVIAKQSPISSSTPSPLISPLHSPSSPQFCSFTRDTVERRSRIIYDDTAEFLQPSQDGDKSVNDKPDSQDQKPCDVTSITASLFREFDSMLEKYQKETQSSLVDDISVINRDERVLSAEYPTADTNTPDLITNTVSTVSHSCSDCKSNSSCDFLRLNSEDVKSSNTSVAKMELETETAADKSKSDEGNQRETSPHSVQVMHHFDSPNTRPGQTPGDTEPSQENSKPEKIDSDLRHTSAVANPVTISDSNNNKRFLSQSQQLIQHQARRVNLQACPDHGEKSTRCKSLIKTDVQQPDWIGDDDGAGSDESDDDSGDDDSSSSTSSSSVASSSSSSDTVVEVPSFPSTANAATSTSSNNPFGLSPLKLEDIFDPGECQQFRSELVQRWQKNIPENESVSEPVGHASPNTNPSQLCLVNPGEAKKSPVNFVGKRKEPEPYLQKFEPVPSSIPYRHTPFSQKSADNQRKRLSWPLRSPGKGIFKKSISDWGRTGEASPENGSEMNGTPLRQENPVVGSIMDSRFMLKPAGDDEMAAASTEQLNGQRNRKALHLPGYPGVVHRSYLSQVRLSNPPASVSTATTTTPLELGSPQMLPSYSDQGQADISLHSKPTNLRRNPPKKFLKRPPSYEDHISKYGLPSKFRSSPASDSYKQKASSLKLWRAEPVTISEVRTIQLHSAQDIFQMKNTGSSSGFKDSIANSKSVAESHSEITSKNTEIEPEQAPVNRKHRYSTGSCPPLLSTSLPGSKMIQSHPTPPRRRRKLQQSYSDEGTALINDGLPKSGKRRALNSGKNHNIYLMLTL